MIANYLQTDPRWASISYSAPGESTTIGKAGCGPTSAAMVIATWADPSVTPETTAAWSLKNGYKAKNQGTYYSYFKPQMAAYGIMCHQVNSVNIYGKPDASAHEMVKKTIKKGDLVIACMGKGNWTSSGHFVLLYNILEGTAYINDPNSTASERTKAAFDLFKSQVKYYFVCEQPTSPKREEEGKEMTQEQFNELLHNYIRAKEQEPPSEWASSQWEKAKQAGLFDGTRPQSPLTRQEAAVLLERLELIRK